MDWFVGENLNRKPMVFTIKLIGGSGSNFPIIQFYDTQLPSAIHISGGTQRVLGRRLRASRQQTWDLTTRQGRWKNMGNIWGMDENGWNIGEIHKWTFPIQIIQIDPNSILIYVFWGFLRIVHRIGKGEKLLVHSGPKDVQGVLDDLTMIFYVRYPSWNRSAHNGALMLSLWFTYPNWTTDRKKKRTKTPGNTRPLTEGIIQIKSLSTQLAAPNIVQATLLCSQVGQK